MPTLQPHEHRQMAESFGIDAERYDRARPPYPDALIAAVVANGRDVLDVGCGTGIVARQLTTAGATVVGVEPDARMAEFARRGGIPVDVATFEDWEPAGRMFDAVVAGQAWHWVDPVVGARKAAGVLRPGGTLTLFWHVFEPPEEVRTAFAAAFRRAVPDSPIDLSGNRQALDVYGAMMTKAADGMREAGGFGVPERWRFDRERSYTREQWLDLLPTTGGLTRLPADTLAEVLAAVGAAIGDGFTMSLTTVAISARRD